MALYTIGDFHLSFSGSKPMDIFGQRWENHAEKLRTGFSGLNEDDVIVICGDLSWAMNLEEAKEDFAFIDSLPGKKIIIKGNHDYWWSTRAKILSFFKENGFDTLDVLNNSSFSFEDVAVCGTRGWFFEEETGSEHDRKIMLREVGRLKASLESAGNAEKIVFLHYPPIFGDYRCEEILQLLKDYGVRLCCYGHIHGKSCRSALNGWSGGTEFRLVSADFLDFRPLPVPRY